MIKHWQLTPGEIVTLRRGRFADPYLSGIPAVFHFRDTRVAFFTVLNTPTALEFTLGDDGSLKDHKQHPWHVALARMPGMAQQQELSSVQRRAARLGMKDTRMVMSEPIGYRPNLTAGQFRHL